MAAAEIAAAAAVPVTSIQANHMWGCGIPQGMAPRGTTAPRAQSQEKLFDAPMHQTASPISAKLLNTRPFLRSAAPERTACTLYLAAVELAVACAAVVSLRPSSLAQTGSLRTRGSVQAVTKLSALQSVPRGPLRHAVNAAASLYVEPFIVTPVARKTERMWASAPQP
eukprot:361377-Chlamydomonas_euryale.AAC.9